MNHRLQRGIMISEICFPNIVVMLKNAGYDFMIIDCEHGPFTFREVSDMIAMGRAYEITSLVRIPEIRREVITKYLDMGADGFLIPMVKNRDDAAMIVNYSKYSPMGNRGISVSRAHSSYAPGDMLEYMRKANERTIILVQIELESALEDADRIASTEGVTGLMIGPSDLSMALGVFPHQTDDVMLSAVKKVTEAARAHDLLSGIITSDGNMISYCSGCGMNVFCCGSELRILSKGLKSNLETITMNISQK